MLATTECRESYVGNGSVSEYDYNWKIVAKSNLVVLVTDDDTNPNTTTLVLNTDYTVDGVSDPAGGSITLVNSGQDWLTSPGGKLKSNYILTILRVLPLTQATDLANQDDFYPEDHEGQFDKVTMIQQQQQDQLDRSPHLDRKLDPADFDLTLEPIANAVIGWNADATELRTFTAESLAMAADGIYNTDDLAEGATNLYYTNARADARADLRIAAAVLNDLSDTSVASPSSADLLRWNGTAWAKGSGVTTKGDLLSYSSAQGRLPIGATNGHVLQVDSAQSFGMKWAAAPAVLTVRSVVTTDSPTTSDTVLLCSGASFTITLPTAVGNDGKIFYIQHNGTSLTQVYTLNTTGGQTVKGLASGVYKLYTTGEVVGLYSDGANWKEFEHKTRTAPTSFTPTYSSGFGTVSVSECFWYREGDMVHAWGAFEPGTVTTGFGTMTLPGGSSVDTTKIPRRTNGQTVILGGFLCSINTTIADFDAAGRDMRWLSDVYTDATKIGFYAATDKDGTATGTLMAQENVNSNFGTGEPVTFWYKVPISGWQP